MFNLNFNQLLNSWTASSDRMPLRMAFLRVHLRGIQILWSDLVAYRKQANRKASATFQTMSMERMLNLKFYSISAWSSLAAPTAGGRIWIENTSSIVNSNFIYSDNENQQSRFIYANSEAQPPMYIYSYAEYLSQYDFKVMIPVSLVYDEAELRAEIETYKIAGIRYTIETY